jgi:hypothetical protein
MAIGKFDGTYLNYSLIDRIRILFLRRRWPPKRIRMHYEHDGVEIAILCDPWRKFRVEQI